MVRSLLSESSKRLTEATHLRVDEDIPQNRTKSARKFHLQKVFDVSFPEFGQQIGEVLHHASVEQLVDQQWLARQLPDNTAS